MTTNVTFTCQSLAGIQKRGVLVPDKDGYYSQPVGALRVFNSAGHFYTDNAQAVNLFKNSSAFMRRVQRGAVRGEIEHPDWVKGMSEDEYAARMYFIDSRNVCVHFAGFELDFDNFKDTNGKPLVAIIGRFTPSGVHGAVLEKQLKNSQENVCFSIRAFTIDKQVGRIRQRTLAEIVTFDFVNEPGIHVAEKYKSLTLESHYERPVTKQSMEKALSRQVLNFGRESVSLDQHALFRSLGWADKTPGFQNNW